MSLETANQLKNSYFAKRVVSAIDENGSLNEQKREIFERINEFVNRAKEGYDQVDSGMLSSEPVKSIFAYKTALDTFFNMDMDEKKDEECFNSLLDNIRNEVDGILNHNKEISKENLPCTHSYFTKTRKLASRKSSLQLIKQQEFVGWPTPMRF